MGSVQHLWIVSLFCPAGWCVLDINKSVSTWAPHALWHHHKFILYFYGELPWQWKRSGVALAVLAQFYFVLIVKFCFFPHCCSSRVPFIILVFKPPLHNVFFLLKNQWSFNLSVKEKMIVLPYVFDSATRSFSSLITTKYGKSPWNKSHP